MMVIWKARQTLGPCPPVIADKKQGGQDEQKPIFEHFGPRRPNIGPRSHSCGIRAKAPPETKIDTRRDGHPRGEQRRPSKACPTRGERRHSLTYDSCLSSIRRTVTKPLI